MKKIKYSKNVSLGLDYILSDFPAGSVDLRFVKQAKRAAYRSADYHNMSVDELAKYYVKNFN